MRILFSTALAMIISCSAFSQDTLFTRTGKIIPAKVYEITPTDIKYKKPSNPDGPLYTISKEEIAVIEYKNGSKDVFESASQASTPPTDDAYAKSGPTSTTQVNNNYYGAPIPRPGVNVVLGMGLPYWGGYYRPYYRPHYYGGGWGYYHGYHHYHGHPRRH